MSQGRNWRNTRTGLSMRGRASGCKREPARRGGAFSGCANHTGKVSEFDGAALPHSSGLRRCMDHSWIAVLSTSLIFREPNLGASVQHAAWPVALPAALQRPGGASAPAEGLSTAPWRGGAPLWRRNRLPRGTFAMRGANSDVAETQRRWGGGGGKDGGGKGGKGGGEAGEAEGEGGKQGARREETTWRGARGAGEREGRRQGKDRYEAGEQGTGGGVPKT